MHKKIFNILIAIEICKSHIKKLLEFSTSTTLLATKTYCLQYIAFGVIFFGFFSLTNTIQAKRFSIVVIDPGHGGKDRGTHWHKTSEKPYALRLSKKIAHHLKSYKIKSVLTRTKDVFLSLDERINFANRYKNAIFVSVHLNASRITSIRGYETYYASNEGKKLAILIQKNIAKFSPMPNRGVIFKPAFKVLRKTNGTAVLCELGFLSNKRENKLLKRNSYQEQLAKAIARAISKYRIMR